MCLNPAALPFHWYSVLHSQVHSARLAASGLLTWLDLPQKQMPYPFQHLQDHSDIEVYCRGKLSEVLLPPGASSVTSSKGWEKVKLHTPFPLLIPFLEVSEIKIPPCIRMSSWVGVAIANIYKELLQQVECMQLAFYG